MGIKVYATLYISLPTTGILATSLSDYMLFMNIQALLSDGQNMKTKLHSGRIWRA